MQQAVVSTPLGPIDIEAIVELVSAAEDDRGYRPVSDQFWIDLHDRDHPPAMSLRYVDGDGSLVAYAQGTLVGGAWTVESVTRDDGQIAAAAIDELMHVAVEIIEASAATEFVWLVQGPTPMHRSIAARHRMSVDRQLHQMRRSLPTGLSFEIETRPFDPTRDIDPWVTVNARAFAWNPEQGSWNADSVRARMQEPWFDTEGFLVHERDGRMAGFCWTKVHDGHEPTLGEIYVIAVDPDFHGLGLGRDLTLAGLDHLAGRGIGTGMLFVDADNVAAIRVYDRLGFVIHRTDTMFRGVIS